MPFRLVVEFAGPTRDAETLLRAYRMLDQQLRDHAPLLSRCEDGRLDPGAVTVAIAGIVDVRELLAAQSRRYAFADGTFDDIGTASAPPALVPMISEPLDPPVRLGRPRADVPPRSATCCTRWSGAAHDDGRTVRISRPADRTREAPGRRSGPSSARPASTSSPTPIRPAWPGICAGTRCSGPPPPRVPPSVRRVPPSLPEP